jgi:hypothetical protein
MERSFTTTIRSRLIRPITYSYPAPAYYYYGVGSGGCCY